MGDGDTVATKLSLFGKERRCFVRLGAEVVRGCSRNHSRKLRGIIFLSVADCSTV